MDAKAARIMVDMDFPFAALVITTSVIMPTTMGHLLLIAPADNYCASNLKK
jgi:hypothetical protein